MKRNGNNTSNSNNARSSSNSGSNSQSQNNQSIKSSLKSASKSRSDSNENLKNASAPYSDKQKISENNSNNNNNNNVVTIDPKLNGLPIPNIHVTAFYHIGMAKPGHNVIHIQPLPLTPPPEDPFRVVGVYLCGECAEMGDLGSGAMNHHADATELQ
jgi:hypothetical protein